MDPMERALRLLTQTPHIRAYLRENDPQALQQAEHSIPVTGLELQNDDLNRVFEDWRALRERGDAIPRDGEPDQDLLLRCISFVREASRHTEGAEGDVRVRIINDWCVEQGLPLLPRSEDVVPLSERLRQIAAMLESADDTIELDTLAERAIAELRQIADGLPA